MFKTFEAFRYQDGNMNRPQSTLEKFFHSKMDHIYDLEEEIEGLESKIHDEQIAISNKVEELLEILNKGKNQESHIYFRHQPAISYQKEMSNEGPNKAVLEAYLAGDEFFYTTEGDYLTIHEIEVESYPKIAQYLIDVIYDTYAYQDHLIQKNDLTELKMIPELSVKEGELHEEIKKKYGVKDLDYLVKNIKQVKANKRTGIV